MKRALVLAAVVLFGCGGLTGEDSSGHDGDARLEAELVSANVSFCFCRHGCGPGLDGSVHVLVRNTGADSVSLRPLALEFQGPSDFDLTKDTGLLGGTGLSETLAPGAGTDFNFSLQPDTSAEFATGSYAVRIRLGLGAGSTSLPLGNISIPFLPNDVCG